MTDRLWCWSWGSLVLVAFAVSSGVPSALRALEVRSAAAAPAHFAVHRMVIAGRGAAIVSAAGTHCTVLVYSGANRDQPPEFQAGECPSGRQLSWQLAR